MLMARELLVPLVEKVGLEPTISRVSGGGLNHLDDFSIKIQFCMILILI